METIDEFSGSKAMALFSGPRDAGDAPFLMASEVNFKKPLKHWGMDQAAMHPLVQIASPKLEGLFRDDGG